MKTKRLRRKKKHSEVSVCYKKAKKKFSAIQILFREICTRKAELVPEALEKHMKIQDVVEQEQGNCYKYFSCKNVKFLLHY